MKTPKTLLTSRAVCPECNRRILLNPVWGALSVHGRHGVLCAGSGILPAPAEKDRVDERQIPLFQ